jgi:hypothetical protein
MKKIVSTGLLLIALVLIVLCFTAQLSWWPVRGTATPPHWQEKLGQSILSASLSRQAKGLTNPLLPSRDGRMGGNDVGRGNLESSNIS